jgi:Family of unknown function (DUF6535)
MGLFSAAVAALIPVSFSDPNKGLDPSSVESALLSNILQILSEFTQIPPFLKVYFGPFSLPESSIWVNSLWFLSLSINLTAAMLATLQQQWAS